MPNPTRFGLNYLDPRAPVVADADPNTSAPADNRIIQSPLISGRRGDGVATRAFVTVLDGTSATVSFWWKVEARGTTRWVELTATPVAVAADTAVLFNDLPPDAELFLQVTAVAGAPTLLGVAFC